MSIWSSCETVGWDAFGRSRAKKYGGDVRSYATGWSNHYPTTDGRVERRASLSIAHLPPYCVPGHRDEPAAEDMALGPWLRLSMDVPQHDYNAPRNVIGDAHESVVLDEDAVRALVKSLSQWLLADKVYPTDEASA